MIHESDIQAPYDARAIANYILDIAFIKKIDLTQVSLLKILYFSQGWYLASFDEPLIIHDFEAWQYGPVVKVVRDAFKSFGPHPITSRATRLVLKTGELIVVPPLLADKDASFVTSIFKAYHLYDAWQLSGMTHEAGSPWDRIWNSSVPIGRLALRIKNEDIRAHFLDLQLKTSHS